VSIQGIFAPAGTPAAIIQRLNCEIAPFLQKAETKQIFFKAGV
jgi:tripartite-type tricarboxylate transporter receptor subunit TctC